MRNRRLSIRGLCSLARVSNLPTIFTNVFVGYALGAGVPYPGHPGNLALVLCAGILFYVGGMALNDVIDAPFDARNRPERPIPSGLVSRGSAGVLAVTCLAGGLAVLAPLGITPLAWGATLVGMIVLYNLLHRRIPGASLLMGLCRGLLYVTAAAAAREFTGDRGDNVTLLLPAIAGTMVIYITIVTVMAADEHLPRASGSRPARLSVLGLLPLVMIPVYVAAARGFRWSGLTMITGSIEPARWALILPAMFLLTWHLFRCHRVAVAGTQPVRVIMGGLSAICLIDAMYLGLLGLPWAAAAAILAYVLTSTGHRSILGS